MRKAEHKLSKRVSEMNTMFILMSHAITEQQCADARRTLNVNTFTVVPSNVWSQIPADFESLEDSLVDMKNYLSIHAVKGDYLLVQGDYGATFSMVRFAQEIGLVPVYATTKRNVYEVVDEEKVKTVREFKHVRFRKYFGTTWN